MQALFLFCRPRCKGEPCGVRRRVSSTGISMTRGYASILRGLFSRPTKRYRYTDIYTNASQIVHNSLQYGGNICKMYENKSISECMKIEIHELHRLICFCWMSGSAFWVSGFVFLMCGLVFCIRRRMGGWIGRRTVELTGR